jgi:hypothetical protein
MDIEYEKVVNLLLLQEQIEDEFGKGWSSGISTQQFTVLEAPDAENMLVKVHVAGDSITPDQRRRLDNLIEAHNPALKSRAQMQRQAREQARRELLAIRFNAGDFPPELSPVIEHVNRLTALLQEGET